MLVNEKGFSILAIKGDCVISLKKLALKISSILIILVSSVGTEKNLNDKI